MKLSRSGFVVCLVPVGGLGFLAGVPTALAQGFSVPEISIAGLGTSNALVANPEEIGAVAYNPAAMSFHDHSSISAGLMFFSPNLEVTTATGNHDSEGSDIVVIPSFQGAWNVADRWRIGLGANTPFGLETEWPIGTFPQLSAPIGPLPPGVFHPTSSSLEMFSVVPTAAYKVTDTLSLSAGLDYYNVREVVLNTFLVDVRGDGNGWGWNLGAMYRSGPISVGASFHSGASIDINGDFTSFGSPSIDADADLELPSRFQLGVRYRFNTQWAAEIDWTRIGWSSFEDILVTSSTTGAVLSNSVNNWDDADAYRLGITYDLTSNTQLRFGYTYDETGQTKEYFSARIPDADRQTFSIGAAHSFGSGWELEGGYMYVTWDDNNFRGRRPFNPLVKADVNGTSALNGKYEAFAHIFGIGVSKKFM